MWTADELDAHKAAPDKGSDLIIVYSDDTMRALDIVAKERAAGKRIKFIAASVFTPGDVETCGEVWLIDRAHPLIEAAYGSKVVHKYGHRLQQDVSPAESEPPQSTVEIEPDPEPIVRRGRPRKPDVESNE